MSRRPTPPATSAPRAPTPTLLVVDVGNSSTVLGLYRRGRIQRTRRLPTAEIGPRRFTRAARDLLQSVVPDGGAWASVVPHVNAVLEKSLKSLCRDSVVGVQHELNLGAPITYPDPAAMGPDRLANLAGTVARYPLPAIVVDIGTATTFDIIRARKGYVGGVIAPGPDLMLDYLADRTALLPHIELHPVRSPVGRSTTQAMQLGALHGYRGMVKEIVQQLLKKLPAAKVTLCATGGYAAWVLRGMELPFVYDRDLTLYGIARIYELNVD